MPKNPKRNIQSYQIEGGEINEFEFQKNQNEMAEKSERPFFDEASTSDSNKASGRERLDDNAHVKDR